MRFLVRLATKSAWPGGEPNRDRAIADFQLREGESGLSLWECENDADCDLALAAIACDRIDRGGKLDKLDFMSVPRETVERFGQIKYTPGETALEAANRLHRELEWSADALRQLAQALFDQHYSVTRKTKGDVRKLLLDLAPGAITSPAVEAALTVERERSQEKK